MNPELADSVDGVIRARRTLKVYADPKKPLPVTEDREALMAMAEVAGWAPFHKKADDQVVPWRFHLLDAAACRKLCAVLTERGDGSKIPKMLAAACGMVQATWRPEGKCSPIPKLYFEPNLKNMEHIAAASAAVQNLLLAATARGYNTYWSSGGILAEREGMKLLGVSKKELLLGALFIFPGDVSAATGTKEGDLRDKRGPLKDWARWVEIEED